MNIAQASGQFAAEAATRKNTLADYWCTAARRFGDNIALVADDKCYTYADLDSYARALACRLREAGLRHGDVCGIHLPRSAESVISILAITLSGAAWLPLDPSYPRARLELMADEARIKLLVADTHGPSLHLKCEPIVISADIDDLPNVTRHVTHPWPSVTPDDLAYIIFTSGSTGRPKGIQIEHGALLAFLSSMAELLDPAVWRWVFSVSSPSFDISLLDLFVPFAFGGCVELASLEEARDGRLLKARLDASRPSLLQATPATWRMLLAAKWQGHQGLTLLTGAEAISPAMANDLLHRSDELWNLYGPTETTVWASAAKLTLQDVKAGLIPIGFPLNHVETLIVDDEKREVQTGEIGELWLKGPSLSRGYLERPELTAEKFAEGPHGRAYRTGDRVSLRPDGQLAFHGRIDNQIKLNSFRIEPSEVENVLCRHEAIREVIVTLKSSYNDEQRLVAYALPATHEHDAAKLTRELHTLARNHMPGPMCPSQYVFLDELPLTPSGKIDRNALPDPVAERPALADAYVAPRDALELRLARVFQDILRVQTVGVTDNFFELGGDSLATVELLLALEEQIGLKVELPHFLERPSVEGLVEHVNEQRNYRPSTAIVSLRTEGDGTPLFFIHGAGGLAFTVFELAQSLGGDFPIFAVQDPACDPAIEPQRRLEDMAKALIAQVRTVQPQGPYQLCGHSFGGLLVYEMARQLKVSGEEVRFLGMLDTPTPPQAAAANGLSAKLSSAWRELRFLGQILTQAGPMAVDGCYVLFGAEARYHNSQADGGSRWNLRKVWSNAMFAYFHKRSGLASAVDRRSRLLMMRQPGIGRSVYLTGIHDKARRTYRPGAYEGIIHLFRALDGSAETQGFQDKTLGWGQLAREVQVHWAPGTHFSMTRGDNHRQLAKLLDKALLKT